MVNILLGCTGSVATIKVPALIELLFKNIPDANIKVVITQSAKHFFSVAGSSLDVSILKNVECYYKSFSFFLISNSLS